MISIWPIDKRFDERLFNLFISSIDVSNFLAMEYKLSPFWTVYVVSKLLSVGIFRTWPIDSRFDVKLLALLMASTVVLYSFDILYRESPLFTVYVMVSCSLVVFVGSFKTWPIDRLFDVRLFASFRSSTVIPYLFAILYKESPLFTVYVFSGTNGLGILSNCPTDNMFDVKLFIFFNSSTVVPLSLAIEYKESPFFTI